MARKISYIILIDVLLVSCLDAGVTDWTSNLERDINRMTMNINEQVGRFTKNLHKQIQENVESSLRPALEHINSAIENLPRDGYGRVITNNGNLISINTGNGLSRTIMSGHAPDGEPYVRDVEERYEGNVLYHNETTFYPRNNTNQKIRWKLDLATPGATPEILSNEN